MLIAGVLTEKVRVYTMWLGCISFTMALNRDLPQWHRERPTSTEPFERSREKHNTTTQFAETEFCSSRTALFFRALSRFVFRALSRFVFRELHSRKRNRHTLLFENEIVALLFAKKKSPRCCWRKRNRHTAVRENEIVALLFAKMKPWRCCSRKRNRHTAVRENEIVALLFAKKKSSHCCSRKRNRHTAVR